MNQKKKIKHNFLTNIKWKKQQQKRIMEKY